MSIRSRVLAAVVPVAVAGALAGCGETAFRVAGDASTTDATTDHASVDVASREGGAKDGAAGDAGSVCVLKTAADTVYVSTPDGGAATNAIAQGIAAATALSVATAYVCVGPGKYAESNLVVPPHVTVVGMKGPASTTISGTSTAACPQKGVCALQVHRGAALRGFTVVAPRGPDASTLPEDGIVMLPAADGSERLLLPPAIENVVVNGFVWNGVQGTSSAGGTAIVALSDADVGPDVTASHNAQGLLSSSPGPATVHIRGTTNDFSFNGGHGLDLTGAASLIFEGGTTNSNGNCGIRLGGTAASPDGGAPDSGAPLSHTIAGLTATGNGVHGVAVYISGQLLKLQ